MSNLLYYPLHSLDKGHWFKLICGASFQALPAVRSLVIAYTLAGADCIDVSADAAVIVAAQEAITVTQELSAAAARRGFQRRGSPFLMVSLNDGEDPHFRKAEFDSAQCPSNCARPCEAICPAEAIAFSHYQGVIEQRCYGCGRCLPICPSQLIATRSTVTSLTPLRLIEQMNVDALEIHTQVGHQEHFRSLWSTIAPVSHQLKLLAISCPDGPDLIDYLRFVHDTMSPLPCPLVWQTDGRPMSGDLGTGTTRATVRLAQKVLQARLPGYVQLAGGTNAHTVTKLRELGLLKRNSQSPGISGIAYGSYARSLLAPIIKQLDTDSYLNFNKVARSNQLENCSHLLWEAVERAASLVSPLKTPRSRL
ncbi:MAG: circadian clock protein LdpA [Cyanophyceae cyanobacterium]